MVVHCHRQRLFGDVLANDILIKRAPDFCRLGHADIGRLTPRVFVQFFIENTLANVDAAIADINAGTGDQFAHLCMALATEGAHGEVGSAGHNCLEFETLLSRRFAR